MKRDKQTLKDWLKNLDANQPVPEGDPRYVNFNAFETGNGEIVNLRGGDWFKPLFDCIDLSDQPTCQLFSGFSGTGKTTELLRLKTSLSKNGYTVLWADASDYHDLGHPLHIEELIVILAAAFGELSAGLLGNGVLKASYWERFREFLQAEIDLKETRIPTSTIDLKVALRNGGAPFWLQVRRFLDNSLGRLKKHAHAYIAECAGLLHSRLEKPIVFIIDSLEKLRGIESDFNTIMQSVADVFSNHSEFLKLPNCHVIYTVPPYAGFLGVGLSQKYHRVIMEPMPAVTVTDRYADTLAPIPDAPSYQALRSLIAKRIPLEEVFGAEANHLDRIILYSGGHVRTLINMVNHLIFKNAREDFPVSKNMVDATIRDFRRQAKAAIRPEGIPVLKIIGEKHDVSAVPESQLSQLARYMDHHMVLCYRNGEDWYEVHPLVQEDIASAEA